MSNQSNSTSSVADQADSSLQESTAAMPPASSTPGANPTNGLIRNEPGFFRLPLETRLQIYRNLFSEITILCKQSDGRFTCPCHGNVCCPDHYVSYEVAPDGIQDLLVVSKKISQEVILLLEKTPVHVRIEGIAPLARELDHPLMIANVRSLTVADCEFPPCAVDSSAARIGALFSNLDVIEIYHADDEAEIAQINVDYWLSMLEITKRRLKHKDGPASQSPPELLEIFREAGPLPRRTLDKHICRMATDESQHWVEKNGLTVKTTYNFSCRVHAPVGWPYGPTVREDLFQSNFKVTVIWDRQGVHLEGLPDLRSQWWWQGWVSNSPFVEATGERFEVEFDDGLKPNPMTAKRFNRLLWQSYGRPWARQWL